MANAGLKNYILSRSPKIELFIRKLYRANIKHFSRFKKQDQNVNSLKDFSEISEYLKKSGVEGKIVIMHASYDALLGTGKKPNQIIDELLDLVGPEGTLAMNSARKFPEEAKDADYLNANYQNQVTTYHVQKSRPWTGVLPFSMLKHSQAEISRFPINPMVAIGKHAKPMMQNNLVGDLTCCGKDSSWNYCVEHDAIIVGLGIDLTHSLTIIHVAEDVLNNNWPIKNWYRERTFNIIDNGTETIKIVKERRPEWGALHFAERTLCRDLLEEGILHTKIMDGVLVEFIWAKELINYLNSRNKYGYPYFCVEKYLK